MIYLIVTLHPLSVKPYYSLSRLCKDNGLKKIDSRELPKIVGKFIIMEEEVNTKI